MNDEIIIKEYDRPLPINVEKLQKSLDGRSKVVGVRHRISENFISLFLDYFADTPLSANENLSKSNWTHHVYFAFRSAAKILYLGCTFETMGRLDAVIDTLDDYPGVILVAEWESDAASVFGGKNELSKLWNGSQQHPEADAFLLTYCNVEKLNDFVKQVAHYWQSQVGIRKNHPSLFLVIVACEQEKRNQRFLFVRTLEISSSTVFLWHDFSFITDEEYLKALDKPEAPFKVTVT
jgi:hypothetical protein